MNTVETVYAVGGSDDDGWVVWSELWVGRTLISNQVEGVFQTEREARIHRDGLQTAYAENGKAAPEPEHPPSSGPLRDFDPVEPAYLCPNCGQVISWGEDELGSCNHCGYALPFLDEDDFTDHENEGE